MKKNYFKILFITLLFLNNSPLFSQSWKMVRHEVQAGIGFSNFFGDLGGGNGDAKHDFRDLNFSMTRPSYMLGYKFMVTPSLHVKANYFSGYVSGDDAKSGNTIRENRNLSFRSGIWEFAASAEYYPFTERIIHRYKIRGVHGNSHHTFSPYITAGVGFLMFQPKAKIDGEWVKLQPLGTEGQGLAGRPDLYKRYTMSFPVGIGVKYLIDRNWSIGFEFSLRYTLSDYIDDVSTSYYHASEIEAAYGTTAAQLSDRALNPELGWTGVINYSDGSSNYLQRGDPRYNDAYTFAIFSAHYRFAKGNKFVPRF